MKKIAKLSLVAAVAVAGLTTANAQPLEEAIKNVDVSGSVVYRYNDYNGQDGVTTGQTSTDDYAKKLL
jgi:ACT domain-containing protein